MLDRQLNIFFFFATLFVFLLFSEGSDHTRFFLSILLSFLFVSLAYVLNWLTLDGAASSIIFGVIALGLGGFLGAAVVLGFFITSSLLSKDEDGMEGYLAIHFRRNGMQVWSNGFWFAFWIVFWYTSDSMFFLVAATSAMAFSTADTWGSEIGGKRIKRTTWLFGSFKKVPPGVDGGVSIIGTIATFFGALLIGLIIWVFNLEFYLIVAITVALAGFLGSFVDSLIGTYIQGKKLPNSISAIYNHKVTLFDNNLTNWVSSGVSSLIGMSLYFIVS